MIKKLLSLSIICTLFIGCSKKEQTVDEVKYVKTFVISNESASLGSTFHGIIHAEHEPDLSFRVAGKIISRNVDIGQSVTKNQVLAKLDPSDLQLSQASANSQLAAAKSAYITQQANLSRYKSLLAQNFVSQAQYDMQKAQYDNAKAQYEQAQNQLSNSENQVNYTTLMAPDNGVITSLNIEVGQVVSPGQVVANMAISGLKEVVIELPEAQINNYKVGMAAKIKIWALNKYFDGKIRIINSASNQQTRTYTARITINNADDSIKYGMAADIIIKPLNDSVGIDVPLNSIYSTDGKSYVWLIDKNQQAQLAAVDVLNTDGELAKINSDKVHNGDKIVAAGANFIHQGQKLQDY